MKRRQIPKDLKDKLKPDSKARIMILLDDAETVRNNFVMSQFLKGYLEKDAIYDNL
ncbi:conserved hypothetical protein [Candidatus Brocadia pituitae]|nr:conserved hypothetical protein [Candidatus Brocadia pituitae]